LIEGVAQYGSSWTQMAAALLPGRTGPQCLRRWERTLNPEIKAGPWTRDEVGFNLSVDVDILLCMYVFMYVCMYIYIIL
jgi:hypothetical protein